MRKLYKITIETDDVLMYEVFSPKDSNEFKQKTGIKQLPCELVNNETFKKVFYFIGGQ